MSPGDADDHEPRARELPCPAAAQIGAIDREPLDGRTNERLLAFPDRVERLRERAIGGVGSDDPHGVNRSRERIEPPGLVGFAHGFDPEIRIGALQIGADLGPLILDGAVGGVHTALQRIAVDVHEAGWRLLREERRRKQQEQDGGGAHGSPAVAC